jgi:hypothetical protein
LIATHPSKFFMLAANFASRRKNEEKKARQEEETTFKSFRVVIFTLPAARALPGRRSGARRGQGDRVGRIFACRATVFFG